MARPETLTEAKSTNFGAISDYNDLHHLDEAEFYSRLDRLKLQQRQELLQLGEGKSPKRATTEPVEVVEVAEESLCDKLGLEDELLSFGSPPEATTSGSRKVAPTPKPSATKKKSVRISSDSRTRDLNLSHYGDEFAYDRLRINVTNPRSQSASPRRTRSLTVPRPFKMTQR